MIIVIVVHNYYKLLIKLYQYNCYKEITILQSDAIGWNHLMILWFNWFFTLIFHTDTFRCHPKRCYWASWQHDRIFQWYPHGSKLNRTSLMKTDQFNTDRFNTALNTSTHPIFCFYLFFIFLTIECWNSSSTMKEMNHCITTSFIISRNSITKMKIFLFMKCFTCDR